MFRGRSVPVVLYELQSCATLERTLQNRALQYPISTKCLNSRAQGAKESYYEIAVLYVVDRTIPCEVIGGRHLNIRDRKPGKKTPDGKAKVKQLPRNVQGTGTGAI